MLPPDLNTELLLIALPIKRLIDLNNLEVTPKDLLNIQAFPLQAKKRLTSYIAGSSTALALGSPTVTVDQAEKLMTTISTVGPEAAIGSLIDRLTQQGMDGITITAAIKNHLTLLQAFLPKRSPESEVQDLAVSRSQLMKFTWVLRILDNPLWVFNLMMHQQLTAIDVNTLKTAYPLLYQSLSQLLVSELIAKGTILTRPKKLMLSIFLQIPVITPEVLQVYVSGSTNKSNKAEINTASFGA